MAIFIWKMLSLLVAVARFFQW